MDNNIYQKIEQIYSNKSSSSFEEEILKELKEIKKLLIKISKQKRVKKHNYKYYEFVNELREKLKPNYKIGTNPTLIYQSQRLGINAKNYLYFKDTGNDLSAIQAFNVYKHFYEIKDRVDEYIVDF